MGGAQRNFRGNPQHLALLVDSARRGNINFWNSYARKMGSSFYARLAGASLRDLPLGEANLIGADLRDSDMSGANLARANLSGASLQGAKLVGANLRGARLDYCNFSKSNLSRANLESADLRTTILTDAILIETSGVEPAKAADISGLRTYESDADMRPWVLALKEETQRRELRLTMEKKQAKDKRRRLNKRLGRRRPLFRRVK